MRAYLIQNEHFGFPDKRSRQGYALSLASRQQLVCHLQPIRQSHSLPCLILTAHVFNARSFTSSAQLAIQQRQSIVYILQSWMNSVRRKMPCFFE